MNDNPSGESPPPHPKAVDIATALLVLGFWLVVYLQKGRWHEGAFATAMVGGLLALTARKAFAAGGKWTVALYIILAFTLVAALAPPRLEVIHAGSIGSVPYQLPGPADTWAEEGMAREISVILAGGASALVRLRLMESHDSQPPALRLMVEDCDLGLIHIQPGHGLPRPEWRSGGKRSDYTVMIPSGCLAGAENKLSFQPVKGSWIAIRSVEITNLPRAWEPWRYMIWPWNWLLFWICATILIVEAVWRRYKAGWSARRLAMHGVMWIVAAMGPLAALGGLAVYVEARTPWLTSTEESRLPREMYGAGKFIHDATLGWKLLPNHTALTQRSPDHEPEIFYVNNKEGFRALGDEMEFPPQGRAMLLGDSFTQGEFLAQEQTIAAVMSRRLGGYVYNFGILGYSTDQEYTVFMEWVDRVDAQWVALLFFPNDVMFIDQNTGHGFDKPWYQIENGRVDFLRFHPLDEAYVKEENMAIMAASEAYGVYCCHTPRDTSLARRAALKTAVYLALLHHPGKLFSEIIRDIKMVKMKMASTHSDVTADVLKKPETYRSQFQAAFDFIARINEESAKRGKKFLAVFVPDIIQIYKPQNRALGNFRDMFMDLCSIKGVPCLDTSARLAEMTKVNDTYFIDDGHLSPFGAEVLGGMISDAITAR
ncbi:MAG: SGNH/GDSL hydrolase family protein [Nitrospinota bacterium]|nr:SGNH/GDSL hydrolase family protein [Nitrospinota bacterium]